MTEEDKGDTDDPLSEGIPDKILEKLSEENRREIKAVLRFAKFEAFAGPLPPPKMLAEYEKTIPGSGNRIIALAENQQQHRHKMEAAVIGSDIVMERLGLGAGFILCLVLLVGSIYLFTIGKELVGAALLVTNIASIGTAFRYSQQHRQKELAEQRRQLLTEPEGSEEERKEVGSDETRKQPKRRSRKKSS